MSLVVDLMSKAFFSADFAVLLCCAVISLFMVELVVERSHKIKKCVFLYEIVVDNELIAKIFYRNKSTQLPPYSSYSVE